MAPESRRWLRVAEVAALLGVHERTIRRLCSRHELPFIKRPGIGVRLDWKKIEESLERAEIIPAAGRGRRRI